MTTKQMQVNLPDTPEEVITFIGGNFSCRDERGEPEDWLFTLSVHDLLSSFFDLRDSAIEPAPQAAVPKGWDAEFLSKRLSRVAKLAGIPMPDMTHEQIAEVAGTILGQIATALARTAPVVAEGWKLVPIEPTPDMLAAGIREKMAGPVAGDIYAAMIAAAQGDGT